VTLALRTSIRRSLVVVVVVCALAVGYVAHVGVDSSGRPHGAPVPTKKFSPSQLLLAASTAEGIHLRYAGITTGPLNSDHSNDIPITSFSFGVTRPVGVSSSGARSIGKTKAAEITLTHQTDSFSLPLLTASLKGTGANAFLYFTNLGGIEGATLDYLEIDLSQTLISSFSMSSGGDTPSESISLNFVSMTFKYRIGDGGGPVNTLTYNFALQR